MRHRSRTFAIMIVLMFVFGCKKDSASSDPVSTTGPLTEAEKQAIMQTHQSIAATADTILLGGDPLAGFQQKLSSYRSYANVENAWTDVNGLHIAYKKAGVAQWYVAPEPVISPYDHPLVPPKRNLPVMPRLAKGANTNVCLVNTMDQDESRTVYRDYFAYVKRKFQLSGFQVTEVLGPN
ncbi:MAG: hypothetical protein HY961_03975, partial [Ignavibacteriae bacterium]|nr:hypothetical protein [Ignavibacteriota bacterium]